MSDDLLMLFLVLIEINIDKNCEPCIMNLKYLEKY